MIPSSPAGFAANANFMPDLFEEEKPQELTAEQEELKRNIYAQMSPRRRKFVDRIGYENWDPFQAPKEPLDMRRERTGRTLQELVRDFMRDNEGTHDDAWEKGASECALGIFRKDERYRGIFAFCLWYQRQLKKLEENNGQT